MARRRKRGEQQHVNHERWLVSYADFITLLFAFFVVLFAISQVDQREMGRLSKAVQQATNVGVFDDPKHGPSPILGGQGSEALASDPLVDSMRQGPPGGEQDIGEIKEQLNTTLSGAIGSGRVALVERDDGLVIRLRDAAFFEAGKAQLRAEVLDDLRTVGQTLQSLQNSIRIEGHTDPSPIHNSLFKSNWELSAARAASVLDELAQSAGVQESRMSIAGYASQRPIASNDDAAGRSQNRRVDMVVLNRGLSPP